VTDKNGDIVFQPHRHHWVDERARRRRRRSFQIINVVVLLN